MEAIRVEQSDVIHRLDAEYYQQKFVDADRRVCNFRPNLPIEKIWREHNRTYIGIAGFDFIDDLTNFTPFLRPVDIGLDGEIDYSNLPWCKKEWLDDHERKGCGQPRDLIVEVKGNTRKVAVLDQRIPDKCIVSGSSYRIQLQKGHDPHFVQAYLLSPTGQLLKRRLVSNTAVSYIDPASFRKMLIPTPSFAVQSYIGDKGRQAELLRTRARRLIQRVDAHHSGLIPQPSIPRKKLWTRVNLARLAERLDAEHYPGVVSDYFSALSCPVQALEKVTERVFSGTSLPKSDTADGFQATVANLSTHFLEPQLRRVQLKNSIGKRTRNHDLLICAAAHTASYIGKDITYGTSGEAPIIPSTEVLLVRPDRSIVPSSYVRAFFQSPIGYRQIQACVRGITAHLYSADLEGVRLPIPDVRGVERDSWFECDEKLLAADEMTTLGRQLVASARLLIEALIEHNVTETELVAAHKDPEADRALMARLSASGLDATDAAPLFPDFDRLEELLKEAQQGNDE